MNESEFEIVLRESLLSFSRKMILDYLNEAYAMCYFGYGPPDLYEIYDNLTSVIEAADEREFTYELGIITRNETRNIYFVEMLLNHYLFHFISSKGVVYNDCHNILLKEWYSGQ